MAQLFTRKDYFNLCESWKLRKTFPGIMYDVFDGEVWKKFSDPEKMDFLNHPGRICLMLNVDWFQPYKHIQTNSIGAIYAVIMNLPRRLRFKKENLLLIGLIPNMAKEPPINTFLAPLIEELLTAWDEGFDFSNDAQTINIKCAMLCVGCDIPASRKLCGFKGNLWKQSIIFSSASIMLKYKPLKTLKYPFIMFIQKSQFSIII